MYDIVPDVHGDLDRLERTLARLGYCRRHRGWRHRHGRRVAFLGDFIDGGPANGAVLATVRAMLDTDDAVAVMGNHELNALQYHHHDGIGRPLRPRTAKNARQHATFLEEFPAGRADTRRTVRRFLELPLFLDVGPFRLVHAYWDDADVATIRARRPDGRLRESDLEEVAGGETAFAKAVDRLLKAPEADLPDGHGFTDHAGHHRRRVRVAWWRRASTWREAALSVPDAYALPDTRLPSTLPVRFYEPAAKPVFVGHYKMPGEPTLAAANVACLDYPATPCAYRWPDDAAIGPLHRANLHRMT